MRSSGSRAAFLLAAAAIAGMGNIAPSRPAVKNLIRKPLRTRDPEIDAHNAEVQRRRDEKKAKKRSKT